MKTQNELTVANAYRLASVIHSRNSEMLSGLYQLYIVTKGISREEIMLAESMLRMMYKIK